MLSLISNTDQTPSGLRSIKVLPCRSTSRRSGSTTLIFVAFAVIIICMVFTSSNLIYLATTPGEFQIDASMDAYLLRNKNGVAKYLRKSSSELQRYVVSKDDDKDDVTMSGNTLKKSDNRVSRAKIISDETVRSTAALKGNITSNSFKPDPNNKTAIGFVIEEDPSQIDNIEDPADFFQLSTVSEEESTTITVDFVVAGFPKCGTTTLLYSFEKHPETVISKEEYCSMDRKIWSDDEVAADMHKHVEKLLSNQPNVVGENHQHPKVGMKCPTSIKDFIGLQRLVALSAETKVIVGLRHPVFFFESYYNYRVTENYERHLNLVIPPAESLLHDKEWKGISTNHARFELSLMSLNKVKLNPILKEELQKRKKPMLTPLAQTKVFLYSIEQLEDQDSERSGKFRRELQQFLKLGQTIEPFSRENVNNLMKEEYHHEYIDICSNEKHTDLRKFLVSQAEETSRWILEEFGNSQDVVIGGREYFTELLKGWKDDPCQNQNIEQ